MTTCQKETDIFLIEGTCGYTDYTAVLRDSVNSPETHIQSVTIDDFSECSYHLSIVTTDTGKIDLVERAES